jgi:dihydrofolate reductase
MPKVIADITMSLDGYVTGPGADPEHGLGDAPELHAWVTEQDPVDTEILEGATAASGAVVMVRRLFDTVDGPHGWSKDMGYGAQQVGTPPFFVVTHSPPQDVRLERELGMRFTFVPDLETAIDQARAAATDGDVVIMGGGDVIGQALERGIVDEFRVHLAPIVVGGGTPLFRAGTRQRYRQRDVRPVEQRSPHRLRAVDRRVGRPHSYRRPPSATRTAVLRRLAETPRRPTSFVRRSGATDSLSSWVSGIH